VTAHTCGPARDAYKAATTPIARADAWGAYLDACAACPACKKEASP